MNSAELRAVRRRVVKANFDLSDGDKGQLLAEVLPLCGLDPRKIKGYKQAFADAERKLTIMMRQAMIAEQGLAVGLRVASHRGNGVIEHLNSNGLVQVRFEFEGLPKSFSISVGPDGLELV